MERGTQRGTLIKKIESLANALNSFVYKGTNKLNKKGTIAFEGHSWKNLKKNVCLGERMVF